MTNEKKKQKLEINKETGINPNMDPKLQRIVQNFRDRAEFRLGLVSTSEIGEEITDVIVRVKDPNSPIEGLSVRTVVGQLITGSVPLSKIEQVREHKNVLSMKASVPVRKQLSRAVPEIHANQISQPPRNIDGSGIIIGIVDLGCDFRHNNFRNGDGTSRILFLWDQSCEHHPKSPAGYGYGREFNKADIDSALNEVHPYKKLKYDLEPGCHGTHVMDIAAGNGSATGTYGPGVAPKADIIFVDANINDIDWEGPDILDSTFGDSVKLIEGVNYIFEKAAELNRPAVVNISLGTNGGPHDGTSLVEQYLDQLLLDSNNRAIVIAASNSYADRIHSCGKMDQGRQVTLEWEIGLNDFTDNELEVWYSGEDELEVEMIDPAGNSIGKVAIGENAKFVTEDRIPVLFIVHRRDDPNNHDNMIDIFISKYFGAGTWQIVLHPIRITNGLYYSWIERDDGSPSMFSQNSSKLCCTLGSISTGKHTIAVGSYDPRDANRQLSYFSSAGPTRDGREKPEVSAPGHTILAARSRSQGAIQMSGTSMAAPAVTGTIALMMQAGKKSGNDLGIQEIRDILMHTSRNNPPYTGFFDCRYGFGRIDALEAVNAVDAVIAEDKDLIESSHPYPKSYDNTWTITEPEARQIRIHFSKLETEVYFDRVYIYDKDDIEITRYDGTQNDIWTPWVEGDTIKVRLKADSSVQKFGFIVDKKERRD